MKRIALLGCIALTLTGCWHVRCLTEGEKQAGATAGQIAGVPYPLALAIMNAISLGLGAIAGHKNGKRVERKKSKEKEPNHG